jgi:vancomycin resistance protein YoaR
MTRDSLGPIEPKEQSKASVRRAAAQSPAAETSKAIPAQHMDDISSSKPQGRFSAHFSRPRIPTDIHANRRVIGFAAAFAAGTFATFFLLVVVAFGYSGSYANRILPGVHAGSVDLSGLTREEAIAKLQAGFAYLTQGEVTITTPVGVTTITYQQIGRGPDAEAMVDAAMAVGHSGNPVADPASVIHAAAFGQGVPVVVRLDPAGLAQRIHQLVGTSSIPAKDAQVSVKGGDFVVANSTAGYGVDEVEISKTIVDKLAQADAPADLQSGGSFVSLKPQVSDESAQAAIDEAQKMFVDITLTLSKLPTYAAAPSSWQPKSWTIASAQIKSWIIFGQRQDGTYAPAVDPAQVQAYLSGLPSKVIIAAIEPSVIWNPDGSPKDLTPGKDGLGIDLTATTSALSAYLDQLATGHRPDPTLEVVTGPIHPQIATVDSIKGMVIIGKSTIYFFPGPSNGQGKNIRQPALNLNGIVVGPGQSFSFLDAVGPIDAAHGFANGGAIMSGKSDHTGVMGGGICSASTTVFNAAANAGLQIDERHAHFYYINRYPVGRDSTVFSNGTSTDDSKWTNDTPYPIVVRSWATYGSQSSITVQLWSIKVDRQVLWTGGDKTNPVKASDGPIQYVKTLKPGETYRAEYADDGFETWVRRVVTENGAVIHDDTWQSHYAAVTGVVQVGVTPSPSQTPKDSGSGSPQPGSPTPNPTPSATTTASRRRRRLA